MSLHINYNITKLICPGTIVEQPIHTTAWWQSEQSYCTWYEV